MSLIARRGRRWTFRQARTVVLDLAAKLQRTPTQRDLLAARRAGYDVPTHQGLKRFGCTTNDVFRRFGLTPNPQGGQRKLTCDGHRREPQGTHCKACRRLRLQHRYATDPVYRAAMAMKHKAWRAKNRAYHRRTTREYMRAFRQREKLAILRRMA